MLVRSELTRLGQLANVRGNGPMNKNAKLGFNITSVRSQFSLNSFRGFHSVPLSSTFGVTNVKATPEFTKKSLSPLLSRKAYFPSNTNTASRGFGFVKMTTLEQADSAKEGLQGEIFEGRTLSIEKARRNRPRTPTPGKYFGPPKRGDFGRRGGGRYGDRYDDRRGGYGGRRDDYRGGSRYDDHDRRGYGGGRDRDDSYRSRNIDRYESRDDRYASRGDRRGGGGYYERSDDRAGFGAPREDRGGESYGSGRDYSSREDRYGAR